MKYLAVPEVQAVDSMLSLINTSDAIIQGRLEAYSCTTATVHCLLSDRKRLNRQTHRVRQKAFKQIRATIFGPEWIGTVWIAGEGLFRV